MASKQSFKLYTRDDQKGKKSYKRLAGFVLGVTLLVTVGNLTIAFNSLQAQYLVPLQSEIFHSSKYQPILVGNAQKIRQQDLTKIDLLAKNLNYSGTSVEELATLLAQNAITETEKARIIYAWITQHIAYDLTAYNDAVYNDKYPDVEAETVLRDRQTICSGYSNLYFALAEAMNLESAIVIGHAKGATPNLERFQDVNHSWNAVRIDGEWYLLDATWGAGSIVDGQFSFEYKPYYFATAPEELINHHFPKDLGWQLLAQTYTREDFDDAPTISDRFYNLGLELASHANYHISAPGRVAIKLKAPQDVLAIASLRQGEQEFAEETLLVNRQHEHLVVNIAPPAAGIYDLSIYAKHKDDPNQYGEVIKYQIEAQAATTQLPKIYGQFYQYQASLFEPLTENLQPNWSTYFNLVVPQAIEVQVVNTTTERWTPLNGYGDIFVGHVDIQSGNSIVIAKFPGSDEYWKLIEYQSK
ncbi:MAG: transglutaminase domain-containing protein [Cyanobacteria bacterium P01_E01_bin.35]